MCKKDQKLYLVLGERGQSLELLARRHCVGRGEVGRGATWWPKWGWMGSKFTRLLGLNVKQYEKTWISHLRCPWGARWLEDLHYSTVSKRNRVRLPVTVICRSRLISKLLSHHHKSQQKEHHRTWGRWVLGLLGHGQCQRLAPSCHSPQCGGNRVIVTTFNRYLK